MTIRLKDLVKRIKYKLVETIRKKKTEENKTNLEEAPQKRKIENSKRATLEEDVKHVNKNV